MVVLKMVSLALCAVRIPPSQLRIGSQSNYLKLAASPRVPSLPFTFRFKNTERLQIKQRLFTVIASNSKPSGEDSLQEKTNETEASDAGQGPPFLTILAGFLVFLLVVWIVGSILLWLIGLIGNLPPSKEGLFL